MSDNKNNFDVTAHLKFILVPQAPTERCKADKKEKHVFITVAFFFWRGGGGGGVSPPLPRRGIPWKEDQSGY